MGGLPSQGGGGPKELHVKTSVSGDIIKVNGEVEITNPVDVSDRAPRLLGVVYGSQDQQILQRAITSDSLVQLRNAGAEIDPRSIRALTNADIVSSELTKVGGTAQTGRDWSADFSKLDVALSTRAALKQTSSRTPISIAAAGDNTILVASPGNKHKLVKIILLCASAVNITLKSGANNLTGTMPFNANGGLAFDGDFYPLETNLGEAFIINLSGAVQVSGWAQYFTEP
jgi:hypothetical protein